MIYVTTSIEPMEGNEFEISSLSIMRKINDMDEQGRYKFVYSGWYQDRGGNKHSFSNFVYAYRESNILQIVSDICLDALRGFNNG